MSICSSIDLDGVIKKGLELGAGFVDARCLDSYHETVEYDNGVTKDLGFTSGVGVNIRVMVDGYIAYASTEDLSREGLREAVERAFKLARSVGRYSQKIGFAEKPVSRDRLESPYKIDPEDIDVGEKLRLLRHLHSVLRSGELSSIRLFYSYRRETRLYVSSLGDHVEYTMRRTGLSLQLVASSEGKSESLVDGERDLAGWEFIERTDWEGFVLERKKVLLESLGAERVKPGRYDVIIDGKMIGVLLHEAFGHPSEADFVLRHHSVLEGRIGERVASELVTIVDEGVVEHGVFVPYDDEGVKKGRTVVVERGVLKGYLHSLETAWILGTASTGNARIASHDSVIQVRQTNLYMEPGDWRFEELLRDTRRGLYVGKIGGSGGEVSPLMGTFTFITGPGYIVENGEIARPAKSTILSGSILETLKNVDAVTRDFIMEIGICGKLGQMIPVGNGGPHIRVRGMTVGG